jgi:hypothetical protein
MGDWVGLSEWSKLDDAQSADSGFFGNARLVKDLRVVTTAANK